MRSLFLLSTLPLLACACYYQYSTEFDGQCIKRINEFKTYEEVRSICDAEDTHLPIIRSQTDQSQFAVYEWGIWLGLQCDGEKFVWDDASVATYTNFKDPQICNSSYTNVNYYTKGGYWHPGPNPDLMYPVCQAYTRRICDGYHLLEEGKSDDICYLFWPPLSTVPGAVDFCAWEYGHVASIHDQSFNDFIKRTAIGNGLMGGNDTTVWSDGSDLNYASFAPGFPDRSYGDCFAMGTGVYPGKWMNVNCSTLLPFMCTKPKNIIYSTIPPAGCPPDTTYYPGEEVSSPNWGSFTGTAHCSYALIDPDTSKKVELEIIFFESNSCCDFLKIYDGLVGYNELITLNGYYGPVSLNITGMTNAIRLEWNATSGVYVRGWHARVGSV